MPPGVERDVGGIGGTPGRGAGLASPPAAVCGGSLPALPGLGQFSPQKSVRELSARAAARRGAGWARLTGSPARPDLPRSPHLAPAAARPRPRRSLAHPSLSRARPPPGGRAAPETPRGLRLRLGQRAVRPGCGLLAMSAARDSSGHFPLHLLVWNNDYRQLERELRDQVRGGAGPAGAGEGALRGRLAAWPLQLAAPGAADPSVPGRGQGSEQDLVERLLCAGPRAQGFIT